MTRFTSRFTPSVVRAAEILECAFAAIMTKDQKLDAGTLNQTFRQNIDRFVALSHQTQPLLSQTGKQFALEVNECIREMRVERVRRAKERRERQLAREAERQRLIDDGAFA